jgi:hypothetical protein
MSRHFHGRRVVGLIAAYAIALQAVLAVGSLPLRAAGAASDICTWTDPSNAPSAPHHGERQCCVAVGCHSGTGVAPQAVIIEPARYAAATPPADVTAPVIVDALVRQANWPRAPPV